MKNGKLFSKFSLIDAAVLLLIVLVLVVVVVRMGFFSTPDEAIQKTEEVKYETVDCIITIIFRNQPLYLGEPFSEGEKIYQDGKTLGTVQSVQREIETITGILGDGTSVTATRDDAYNYTITVKSTLTKKNGMLYPGSNNPIAVGQSLYFGTHYFYGKGVIIGVEKIQ